MSEERPLVSFVVPLFDEAENVPALIEHLEKAADANPGYAFELIAVDDGSRDQTFSALSNAVHTGLPITTVRLTRNFGSHHAISAGFAHARGDAAIVLGADLQEPMDLVASFIGGVGEGSGRRLGDQTVPSGRERPWTVGFVHVLKTAQSLLGDSLVSQRRSIGCTV